MCELYDSADVATYWSATTVKARRPHLCSACCTEIKPGCKYERLAFLQDGSWSQSKTCLECVQIRDEFGKDHSYYPFGSSLIERVRDCVREDETPKWRPSYAAMLRRYRKSEVYRNTLEDNWKYKREQRERVARARKELSKRNSSDSADPTASDRTPPAGDDSSLVPADQTQVT